MKRRRLIASARRNEGIAQQVSAQSNVENAANSQGLVVQNMSVAVHRVNVVATYPRKPQISCGLGF
jgi:hypothetical protein